MRIGQSILRLQQLRLRQVQVGDCPLAAAVGVERRVEGLLRSGDERLRRAVRLQRRMQAVVGKHDLSDRVLPDSLETLSGGIGVRARLSEQRRARAGVVDRHGEAGEDVAAPAGTAD